MGMKRPKRPTESKPGKVFQTGSSPTNSTRIDLSYFVRVLGGGGSTRESSRVQDGGKSWHAERSANNVHSAESSRSYGLSQDATGSRWLVLSVQRMDPNDESKTTAATDRHDFYQCRSEVSWQI